MRKEYTVVARLDIVTWDVMYDNGGVNHTWIASCATRQIAEMLAGILNSQETEDVNNDSSPGNG